MEREKGRGRMDGDEESEIKDSNSDTITEED